MKEEEEFTEGTFYACSLLMLLWALRKKKLNPRFILLLLMSLKTHIYYFRCELFCVQLQTPPYWRNWSTHFNIFVQLERQQG
jgi:hypothetical protein